MKYYVIFNPLAGDGKASRETKLLKEKGLDAEFFDVTKIESYQDFFKKLSSDDKIVLCGGDGTLNRFVNRTRDISYENEILYYAGGTGNDFLNDLEKHPDELFPITKYLKDLPEITVNGKTYKFLNGIGYGIDGYCCEERDRQKKTSEKKVNYTLIALKGLLFAYKPRSATVTVDGQEMSFEKVWMVPTMKGRYFGGGMMIAPSQDRLSPDKSLTLTVVHSLSKLRIISLFPTIFKGKHVKYTKYIKILKGHNISVKFDRPCALQIDGETILNVSQYSVTTSAKELIKA